MRYPLEGSTVAWLSISSGQIVTLLRSMQYLLVSLCLMCISDYWIVHIQCNFYPFPTLGDQAGFISSRIKWLWWIRASSWIRQEQGGTATGRDNDGFCLIDFWRFWTPSCSFSGDSFVRDRSWLFKDDKAVFFGGWSMSFSYKTWAHGTEITMQRAADNYYKVDCEGVLNQNSAVL